MIWIVSLHPVQPRGCPNAIAPPLILTIDGSQPNFLITARDWEANASFNSIRSIWPWLIPACLRALGTASTGPIPMIRGCTPALAQATNRAIGCKDNSVTIFSLITLTNAAPSLVWDEFPAVTEPPVAKTGLSLDNAASEVSALGPSSVSTIYLRFC